MATKKAKAKSVGRTLPKRLGELRKTAEKEVRKGWERTLGMLPPAQRKSVKRFTSDLEKTQRDLVKRGEKVVKDLRKRTDRMSADVEKAVKDLRKRTDRIGSDVEKRIGDALAPLAKRVEKSLDMATRSDIDRLRKRIDHLEHKVESFGAHASAAS